MLPRRLIFSVALLFLTATCHRYSGTSCPLPTTSSSELISGGLELLSAGEASKARACLVSGGANLTQIADAQLAVLIESLNTRGLGAGGLTRAAFTSTYLELMSLMVQNKIFTLDELSGLGSPLDVIVLHGQLACLDDRESALTSLAAALREREQPLIREIVARIALGRGDGAAALAHATLAARHARAGISPHEIGAIRNLQLQAALMAEGGVGYVAAATTLSSSGTQVVAASSAISSSSDALASFTALRAIVRRTFVEAGVRLPANDPMAVEGEDSRDGDEGEDERDEEDEEEEDAGNAEIAGALRVAALQNSEARGIGHLASDALLARALAPTAQWMAAASPEAGATFRATGYVALRNLIPHDHFLALSARVKTLFSGGFEHRIAVDADQHRRTLWNDEFSLYIGTRLVPAMSALVGLPLVSVYTFAIKYDKGGILHAHKDRPQNAVSVSLTISHDPSGADPWPIWVSPSGGGEKEGVPIALRPNDALLYGGVDHTHFRRRLKRGSQLQVIFGFRPVNETHCNSQ
jgi:hypothetical protein